MLENWRYNRALRAKAKTGEDYLDYFIAHEHQTQLALSGMGVRKEDAPNKIPYIDTILTDPDLITSLSKPFVAEVIGMPRAGKTTSINKLLESLWISGIRHRVRFARESPRAIPDELGPVDPGFDFLDLKHSHPLAFNIAGYVITKMGALRHIPEAGDFDMLLQDRGLFDRRIFRRSLFVDGDIDPLWMEFEDSIEQETEIPPFPVGAVILCVISPEESLQREGPRKEPGVVMNKRFLEILYEQYMRFHYEIITRQVAIPAYVCIDMECTPEKASLKFNNAMAQILNKDSHILFKGLNQT